jgi:type I restriction enzyme S subunit
VIASLKPYPAMKDSGVPWLGRVPQHWEVRPVGGIGSLFKGNGGNKGDEVPAGIPCVRYGDLYTLHEFFITKSKSYVSKERAGAYTPIHYGDILFAASGETDEDIGRSSVNLIEGEARCGGDVLVLRPEIPAVPRYLGYAGDSPASRWQKASMGRGFTVVHIYGSQLKRLQLPLPPLPEQSAIVRFLDHADRRIRRYVRAKQKLVKLLEEQKQAIIHRAVARGLDPDVRLKPSGVEWLGDVPEHWEVLSFTRIAVERADYRGATPTKTESGIFLVTAKNVRKGWIDYEASKEFVAEKDYATIMRRGLPKRDDLLLTMEAPLGHAALVDREDIALAQRIVRFRFDPNRLEATFVLRSVLSPYFQNQLLRRGTGSTALGIKASKLPQLQLLVPPLPEQRALLKWIDRECRPIDVAAGQAESEIALLREYRTRLIADVVTGKLDVREAAERLPQETEDLEPPDEAEVEGEAEENEASDGVPEEAEA